MSGRIRRVVPALLIAGAACAAAPGAALAGEAYVDGDTVVYDAAVGEANRVEVGQVDDPFVTHILLRETNGIDIELGDGCELGANLTTVSCGVSTFGQIAKVKLNLGNQNDSAKPSFLDPVQVRMDATGGPGNDTLTAGSHGGELNGGDGDDNLYGAGAADVLDGYFGNDYIRGGDGADTIDTGAGDDDAFGDDGNDEIHGSLGADALRGGDDADTLYGEGGQDSLLGNLGKDKYFGGTEADSITSADDQAETVDCGGGLFSGADKANVDSSDTAIGCEVVF